MKIQIFSTPRTGTTTLYNALITTINYSAGFFEPMNYNNSFGIIDHDNFLKIKSEDKFQQHLLNVKNCNVTVVEKNTITRSINFLNESKIIEDMDVQFDFYTSYLQNFDKIILLYRRDVRATCKSLSHAIETNQWQVPYEAVPSADYIKYIPTINENNKLIIRLSQHFHIPITYYEDLYSGDSKHIDTLLEYNEIQIDDKNQFYKMLDPQYKLTKSPPGR